MLKAVYAGSFDPFTNGHMYIYKQAAELFGEVIILLADNPRKKRLTDINDMCDMIKPAVKSEKVFVYHGLIADYCIKHNISYLVRGLRNTSDYLYEEEVAKVNAEIFPGLKTVYFRAADDIVSSTLIRLLYEENKNVAKYLPPEIKIGKKA